MEDDFVIKVGEELNDEVPFQVPPLEKGNFKPWGHPERDPLRIIFGQHAYESVMRHAQSEPGREVGGVLVGRAFRHEGVTYASIEAAIRASMTNAGATHLTFTPDSWSLIRKEQEARFPDLRIVGWYHTHPRMDIFLSGDDIFLHEHFFPQPWQVALVVEPHKHLGGFFIWKDKRVRPASGFYELYGEAGKSLINWRNQPGQGAGGGSRPPSSSPSTDNSPLATSTLQADLVTPVRRSKLEARNWATFALLILVIGLAAILLLNYQSVQGLRDDVSRAVTTIEAVNTTLSTNDRSTAVAAAVEATLTALTGQAGEGSATASPILVAGAATATPLPATPIPASNANSTPGVTPAPETALPANSTPSPTATVLNTEATATATVSGAAPTLVPTATMTAIGTEPTAPPATPTASPTPSGSQPANIGSNSLGPCADVGLSSSVLNPPGLRYA